MEGLYLPHAQVSPLNKMIFDDLREVPGVCGPVSMIRDETERASSGDCVSV